MTTPEPITDQSVTRRSRAWLIPAAGGLVAGLIIGSATTAALVSKPDRPPAAAAVAMPAATSAAATTPTAAPMTPTAAPTTATPSPTGSTVHPLGEEVNVRGIARVTAFAFKQPVAEGAPRPPQDGFEWAAADVQVCAASDSITVNEIPWHLVYVDHTTIDFSHTGYNQFPKPGYPSGDKALPNGRCVRGWITFPAPIGKRPISIEHHPDGSGAPLTEWAVS